MKFTAEQIWDFEGEVVGNPNAEVHVIKIEEGK
jgi:hypothetical protein